MRSKSRLLSSHSERSVWHIYTILSSENPSPNPSTYPTSLWSTATSITKELFSFLSNASLE